MAKRKTTPVAPVTEATEERPPCLCGCGGTPNGAKSRFLPGHDARYHAAQKKAATAAVAPVRHGSALQDDELQFVVVAPPVAPAPANAQDRPSGPSRRRKGKGDATTAAGSEA